MNNLETREDKRNSRENNVKARETDVDTRENDEEVGNAGPEKEIGAWDALWTFFSSMKTAIVLLLILAAASIAGTIIEDKTGKSIYGSTWFSMILVLVGVNLTVCSINRFGMVWRKTFHPDVQVTPESVARMTRSETLTAAGTPETVAKNLQRALHHRAYRVVTENEDGKISIYAARGRASNWGAHLTHFSLLVIFAGAIYGNLTGSEGFVGIVEGQRAEGYTKKGEKDEHVKTPLGFQVALKSFKVQPDKNRNPMGYKSDLEVYDGGDKPVARKVVDVNHPLVYKGLSFYQSDYGLVGLYIKVTAPDGSVARIPYNIGMRDTPQGREYGITDDPIRPFTLGGKKLTLFVHNLVPDYIGGEKVNESMLPLNPAVNVMMNDRFPQYKGLDAWKQLGWMTVGKSMPYQGYTVTLERVVKYTGLQISRNPGLPVVYTGFAMMVLGVFLSFYVTFRVIRISLTPSGAGTSVVVGGTSRAEPSIFDKDFKRLHETLA